MAEDIKTMLGDAAERKQLSPEKLKALQLTMDKIDKTYGRGSIMKLGDENIENIEVIPSWFSYRLIPLPRLPAAAWSILPWS